MFVFTVDLMLSNRSETWWLVFVVSGWDLAMNLILSNQSETCWRLFDSSEWDLTLNLMLSLPGWRTGSEAVHVQILAGLPGAAKLRHLPSTNASPGHRLVQTEWKGTCHHPLHVSTASEKKNLFTFVGLLCIKCRLRLIKKEHWTHDRKVGSSNPSKSS